MAQAKAERRGLGRGLSALMADVEPKTEAAKPEAGPRKAELMIDIARIAPNPDQPRRTFTEDALRELEIFHPREGYYSAADPSREPA